MRPSIWIATDLDGTFLNLEDFKGERSAALLPELRRAGVPVVFATSKPAVEALTLQKRYGLDDPFIVENGAAVYYSESFLKSRNIVLEAEKRGVYRVQRLGPPREKLLTAFQEVREKNALPLLTLDSLPLEELSSLLEIPVDVLSLTKQREHDIPFFTLNRSDEYEALLSEEFSYRGYRVQRGNRFYHLTVDYDKAKALSLLFSTLGLVRGEIWLMALGDSGNDLEMLNMADLPVIVSRPDGEVDERLLKGAARALRTNSSGSDGWSEAVKALLPLFGA